MYNSSMGGRSLTATGSNAGGLTIELDAELTRALTKEARRQHKSRADVLKEVIEEYLEDRYLGEAALAVERRNEKTISADEVFRRNGLEG